MLLICIICFIIDQRINTCFTRAGDDQRYQDANHQQVVFKTLAFHITKPVHEKTKLLVHGNNHSQEQDEGGGCKKARKQAKQDE